MENYEESTKTSKYVSGNKRITNKEYQDETPLFDFLAFVRILSCSVNLDEALLNVLITTK